MFIHTGFGNYVALDKILAVTCSDSAPVRRAVVDAADSGRLIDHTAGRRRRAVIALTTGHVVIAALEPETLVERAGRGRGDA